MSLAAGLLCLAIATLADGGSPRKKLLKLYDEMLGKTEDQMRANWCDCIQEIPAGQRTGMRGQKMLVDGPFPAGYVYGAGHPAYSTATTNGQIDKRGNIYATTTATETPATESWGLYLHRRLIFYFDEHRKVYRWELEQCASKRKEYDDKVHTPWETIGVRELRPDKKGIMKPFTVQKPREL